MALRACCSSRVKEVRGTSSDTGRMATVDRLEAGFPESHLLLGVCRARPRAGMRGGCYSPPTSKNTVYIL